MTISKAMIRGTKKAGRIIANPDPRDSRIYRQKISYTNPLEAAWQATGTELQKAMTAQTITYRVSK